MQSRDTIFALSSGAPPAAIAVIRLSGPQSAQALKTLAGRLPTPRRVSLARLRRQSDGSTFDNALMVYMPGPDSATGEDCAELHLHGGRALVSACEAELAAVPGLRKAQPGEFTMRAFRQGRIDLAEAEGLADLLEAETDLQLRNAQALSSGALSHRVADWRERVVGLSAEIETVLDFSDEDDGAKLSDDFGQKCEALFDEIEAWLAAPRLDKLKEGFRVVIAGPPNSGKSSLFNALIGEEAAIATAIAGTTRDVLHRPIAIAGVPFLFADTAGLRSDTEDEVERIGIARAGEEIERADLILWLGDEGKGPPSAWEIDAMCDLADRAVKKDPSYRVSSRLGHGVEALRKGMVALASQAMPKAGQLAISERQRSLLTEASASLRDLRLEHDHIVIGERLRLARAAFDRLLGRTTTEDMLDALFGRFCIGK